MCVGGLALISLAEKIVKLELTQSDAELCFRETMAANRLDCPIGKE